jgi:hypothetical protein|tara:strand:+ start:3176 stop:3667 length:492 start_codon:yes stop_codon:yes gene_type:complete
MLNEPMLDAPIPGQSLTGEPGSKPWEQPPKLTTVEEVVNKYIPMFENEDLVIDFVNQMEAGIPITTIVSVLTKSGVMAGAHSIDTGLIASPVLVEMLISVAEASEIEYKIGTEKVKSDKPRMSAIQASLKDFGTTDDMPMVEEEVPVEEPEEAPMGMMTRRDV